MGGQEPPIGGAYALWTPPVIKSGRGRVNPTPNYPNPASYHPNPTPNRLNPRLTEHLSTGTSLFLTAYLYVYYYQLILLTTDVYLYRQGIYPWVYTDIWLEGINQSMVTGAAYRGIRRSLDPACNNKGKGIYHTYRQGIHPLLGLPQLCT